MKLNELKIIGLIVFTSIFGGACTSQQDTAKLATGEPIEDSLQAHTTVKVDGPEWGGARTYAAGIQFDGEELSDFKLLVLPATKAGIAQGEPAAEVILVANQGQDTLARISTDGSLPDHFSVPFSYKGKTGKVQFNDEGNVPLIPSKTPAVPRDTVHKIKG